MMLVIYALRKKERENPAHRKMREKDLNHNRWEAIQIECVISITGNMIS
jgi:hypothetical protein